MYAQDHAAASAFLASASRPASTDARRAQLATASVLSATPAQLVTMLYDRLMLDLGRAEQAQVAADWVAAREQLLHAQAIVAELSSTLRIDAWDGGDGLAALYAYANEALITANIHRDVEATRQVVRLLEPLRTAWHQAAAALPAPGAATYGGPAGLGVA